MRKKRIPVHDIFIKKDGSVTLQLSEELMFLVSGVCPKEEIDKQRKLFSRSPAVNKRGLLKGEIFCG